MRFRSPVSRGSFSLRFSGLDILCALITPGLVLWFRGAQALHASDTSDAVIFWAVSFVAALGSFLVFRIRDGLTQLFSVQDALDVGKAVALTELLTAFVVFSVTRLSGIPRSVLILHGLFLIAGLVAVRAVVRMSSLQNRPRKRTDHVEHVLFLGANKLTSLYIEFLRAFAPGRFVVVGVLDDAPSMAARSVGGARVLGRTDHLAPIVQEFKEHGVFVTQVLVGSEPDALTEQERLDIERTCRESEIQLHFIPTLIGLSEFKSKLPTPSAETNGFAPTVELKRAMAYARVKRTLDVTLGLVLMLLLTPVYPIVAVLVLLDIGSPVLFWQRRLGLNGRSFHLYKFRTLKPAYDSSGVPIADSRMSWVGQVLRRFRLDELPQLLNVVVGDMSLIGPRPLLPKDQPADPRIRLSVRPGITGWAQVNGGTLLTPEEKSALDEWYVRNMSLRVDLAILYHTMMVLVRGERIEAKGHTPASASSTAEGALVDKQDFRIAAE